MLLAGVIRFTGNVVTQACFALDEMHPVSVSITIEAAVNVAVSVVLGSMIGANGVAIGTGVGAIAGTLTYVVLARRRARLRSVVGAVLSGARRPLLAAVPIAVASPIWLG